MTTSPDVLRQALEALERISRACPRYSGDYTTAATPSDFGNAEDYSREMGRIADAGVGEIARDAIASLRAALSAAPGECLQRQQELESVHLAAGEASRVHRASAPASAPSAEGSAEIPNWRDGPLGPPTFYVAHPNGTFSVADPQPISGQAPAAAPCDRGSAQHTPGPWFVGRRERQAIVTRSEEGLVLYRAYPDFKLADAQLIAAAPELLQALQLLHDDIAEYARINHLGGFDNHCMRLARAAIAKATGSPPASGALHDPATTVNPARQEAEPNRQVPSMAFLQLPPGEHLESETQQAVQSKENKQ